MSRLSINSEHVASVTRASFRRITLTSQYDVVIALSDVLLLTTVVLLALTCVVTFLYYLRIKAANARYEEAKGIVGDIIVSFDKQLQRQEEQLEKASYQIEGISARSDNVVVKVDELGKQTNSLVSRVANISEVQDRLTQGVKEVEMRIDALKKAQQDVEKHISEAPEAKIEAAIPIRRERALAPLTETELRVLEFVAEGGEKTAPAIRDLTKLTREHSARLVKKLYEEGYLERDTGKTPYKYRVKDEMLRVLKKGDAQV
jgi:archaellum component FlaC